MCAVLLYFYDYKSGTYENQESSDNLVRSNFEIDSMNVYNSVIWLDFMFSGLFSECHPIGKEYIQT